MLDLKQGWAWRYRDWLFWCWLDWEQLQTWPTIAEGVIIHTRHYMLTITSTTSRIKPERLIFIIIRGVVRERYLMAVIRRDGRVPRIQGSQPCIILCPGRTAAYPPKTKTLWPNNFPASFERLLGSSRTGGFPRRIKPEAPPSCKPLRQHRLLIVVCISYRLHCKHGKRPLSEYLQFVVSSVGFGTVLRYFLLLETICLFGKRPYLPPRELPPDSCLNTQEDVKGGKLPGQSPPQYQGTI